MTHLLVEGGGEVNGAFLRQKLAHRVAFYFAPKILGGRSSRQGVRGGDPLRMSEALDVVDLSSEFVGNDLFVSGKLKG